MQNNKKSMQEYVIIVAGGKGLRMGSDIPKQFLPIGRKPVLMRTIDRFREYSAELQIILVLPKSQQEFWRQLCRQYQYPLPSEGAGGGFYLLADGGETRFHSVQHGLALIPDDAEGVVGVHDGVRPFPSVEVIRRCYETARTAKAVVPVIPVVETLRHLSGCGQNGQTQTDDCKTRIEKSKIWMEKESENVRKVRCPKESVTVPRGDYRLVQTPQTFDIQLLKAANRQPYNDGFTDDASVVEAYGHPVTLVEGNRENIKITTPFDLAVAKALLSDSSAE